MGHGAARLRTARSAAAPCRAMTHQFLHALHIKTDRNIFRNYAMVSKIVTIPRMNGAA